MTKPANKTKLVTKPETIKTVHTEVKMFSQSDMEAAAQKLAQNLIKEKEADAEKALDANKIKAFKGTHSMLTDDAFIMRLIKIGVRSCYSVAFRNEDKVMDDATIWKHIRDYKFN